MTEDTNGIAARIGRRPVNEAFKVFERQIHAGTVRGHVDVDERTPKSLFFPSRDDVLQAVSISRKEWSRSGYCNRRQKPRQTMFRFSP